MFSIKVFGLSKHFFQTNGAISTIVSIYLFNINSFLFSILLLPSSSFDGQEEEERRRGEKVPVSKRRSYALKLHPNHPVSIADVDEELSNTTHVVSMYFLQGPKSVAYKYFDNLFVS